MKVRQLLQHLNRIVRPVHPEFLVNFSWSAQEPSISKVLPATVSCGPLETLWQIVVHLHII
jgi:hypothetical protein